MGAEAQEVPTGRHVGLYHLGIKIGDSDDELREAVARCKEAGVRIIGLSDHTVSHSLYVLDPDGNELELYIDVARRRLEEQPRRGDGTHPTAGAVTVAEDAGNRFDVICIGAGTVSEGVASELKDTGITFAVIERELVGGECPYWGCIPSKTLLRSAEVLAEAERARDAGGLARRVGGRLPKIAERTHYIARDEDDTKATEALVEQGATIIRGEGTSRDPAP